MPTYNIENTDINAAAIESEEAYNIERDIIVEMIG